MAEKKDEFKIDMTAFRATHYEYEVEALKKEITTPTYTQEAIEGASVIGYIGSRIPVYGIKASAYPLVKIARISNKYLGREKVVDIKTKHYWAIPLITAVISAVGWLIINAPPTVSAVNAVPGSIIGFPGGLIIGVVAGACTLAMLYANDI